MPETRGRSSNRLGVVVAQCSPPRVENETARFSFAAINRLMNAHHETALWLEAAEVPADYLTQLELRIARRADELARALGDQPTRDCWLDAEREIISSELVGVTAD
jgi:hypothetical protein